MARHFSTILLLTILVSCSDSRTHNTSSDSKKYSEPGSTKNETPIEYKTTRSSRSVSDTLKKIIDELDLCQYSEFLKNNSGYDCYDKDISDIRRIKMDDDSYDNFIFQAPGGSAGGTIIIFCKMDGNYKKIQDYEGYIDSVLPSTTKGFYDIRVWHRAKKVGGELVLFKWTGNKYSVKKL